MADYCKKCSEVHFGQDMKDLAGLIKKVDVDKGLTCSVICECCGWIQVNHLGENVDEHPMCFFGCVGHVLPRKKTKPRKR